MNEFGETLVKTNERSRSITPYQYKNQFPFSNVMYLCRTSTTLSSFLSRLKTRLYTTSFAVP